MVLPLIGRLSMRSFGIGAAVASVGYVVARPLIVQVVAAGYEVKDAVDGAWHQAKLEAQKVRADALASRSQGLDAEVTRLREEVASLRSQQSKKSA
jgi:cell division protein FtsB